MIVKHLGIIGFMPEYTHLNQISCVVVVVVIIVRFDNEPIHCNK